MRWLAPDGDGPGVTEFETALQAQPAELDAAPTHPDDMAFWLYSSGSTGKPKGVVHLQHDIEITCENYASGVLGLHPEDVTFSTTKLFHAYGLGNGLSFPLSVGATAIYMAGPTKPAPISRHCAATGRTCSFLCRPCSRRSVEPTAPVTRFARCDSAFRPPSLCPQ